MKKKEQTAENNFCVTLKEMDQTFFSDEKMFKVIGLLKSQKDHFYASKSNLKKDANPDSL